MPPILFDDESRAGRGGLRPRVVVLPPARVERLIEKLIGRLIEKLLRLLGGARG